MSQDYKKSPKYNNWLNQYTDTVITPFYEYISENIDPEDIFIFIDLINPDLKSYEGLIFFRDRFSEDAYKSWLGQLRGDVKGVQMLLNKIALYDIFAHHPMQVEDFVYEKIGKFLRDSWERKCKQDFPELNITVEYSNSEYDYGPTLTLFQN